MIYNKCLYAIQVLRRSKRTPFNLKSIMHLTKRKRYIMILFLVL